ncbi:NAD(P)-dependent oxidoreductase [Bradyrhizobium sp. CCBAU 51753]|uniref:NAD-dependent epimerase/dehydratase family protein n=1 Tax=Bradyrhizobium sp. CCBAU 51753 TaxID=1325100 RepID=UPI00188B80E1|nr:NAD(P)-dependent oxidoreductase [Bradyrhizobium sp. CCBAU 51753]QOZ27917.1 NAD(P)-dependent oxidoreductase [Bradyrhizobium sp. CCBAU 51753]
MRVLLTGSSGWLGRFLAPKLRRAGHSVVGLDIVSGEATDIIGSVAERAVVDRAFADHGIEAVVHGGALHKPDIARFAPQAFVDVNVTGTLNLLQAAAAAGHDRFVFTSTTSLMISQAIRDDEGSHAVWLDETSGPLEPRNIYGITKLAAEGLCRLYSREHGLNCAVLRTSRFFPEDDDTIDDIHGENLKATELLYRRLTVEDAADAHVVALEKAKGFEVFVISAPPPFARGDVAALKSDAAGVIARYFPDAPALFARRGWRLPHAIGRIYDPTKAERLLGFRATTDFAAVLDALRNGTPLPFAHDPDYVSPSTRLAHG